MRLSTALVLFVIAPLLILLAAVGWLGLNALERQVEERKQEEIQLIARAVRLPLSHSMERGRFGAIKEALRSAFEFDRVYGAHVFDRSGRRLAGAGAGAETLTRAEVPEMAGEGDQGGRFARVDGEKLYNYFVPLTDSGGRILGLLQVSRRGAEFETGLRRLRVWGFTVLVGLGLVAAAVVFIGHRRAIGGPIRTLAGSMRRVEAGDRSHRTPVSGPGELRILAEGFNAMLEGIQGSEREIEARRRRQRALEEDLRHSQKLAAIGVLATGVAHELGTPLSVIDGKAQRLIRRHGEEGAVREAAEAVRAEVGRMESTIRQLMDFAGRNPVEQRLEPADLLVGLAVSAVDDSRAGEGVTVEVNGEGSAPDLLIDRNRMQRALVNLLTNAMQAAGPGGLVRIGWCRSAEGPCLYVDDDGPGVSDEVRPRLFEPFFTTKSVGVGTGLGLAIVHGAVEDHGGRIVVERSPELGGARFRIILSAGDNEAADHVRGERAADTAGGG